MQMQEIYQPATIVFLIRRGGRASLDDIHENLEALRRLRSATGDIRQREIRETREKPCGVLENHGVIQENPGGIWEIRDFVTYTEPQRLALIQLCENSIAEWNQRHGNL